MSAKIKHAIAVNQKLIEQCKVNIAELQGLCQHNNVEKTHRGDTGNYDPSEDGYWTDFKCTDCGHRWTLTGTH